jgi:hypothetical protein
VRLLQEWLCLNRVYLKIDCVFGPVTESAVQRFQTARGLPSTGIVDAETFEQLVRPMRRALEPLEPDGRSLGELVVAYARRHLAQEPREVGGPNRGPWVRLYMNGNEGDAWAWCAGFACFCLRQASSTLEVALPVPISFSCDLLAASAQRAERFLGQPLPADRGRISAGSLFLIRRTPWDWTHTGIVVRAEAEAVQTIEGNTNDAGSREGFEVCGRTRAYRNVDFIVI